MVCDRGAQEDEQERLEALIARRQATRKDNTKKFKTKKCICTKGRLRRWQLVIAEETFVVTVGRVVGCKGSRDVREEVVAEVGCCRRRC